MTEMTEIPIVKKKRNILFSSVSKDLYAQVYKASLESGFTMSEIVRLCVIKSLPEVAESLRKVGKVHGK